MYIIPWCYNEVRPERFELSAFPLVEECSVSLRDSTELWAHIPQKKTRPFGRACDLFSLSYVFYITEKTMRQVPTPTSEGFGSDFSSEVFYP